MLNKYLIVFSFLLPYLGLTAQTNPNVIFIMADDMGNGEWATCAGFTKEKCLRFPGKDAGSNHIEFRYKNKKKYNEIHF